MALPARPTAAFDTSPLIFLERLNYHGILGQLYAGLCTPAVGAELFAPGPLPGINSFAALTVQNPKATTLARVQQELNAGRGEIATIALALDLGCLAVLDDRAARRYAVAQKLDVVGTLGVVWRIHAHHLNQRALGDELDLLLDAGMWISAQVAQRFLQGP